MIKIKLPSSNKISLNRAFKIWKTDERAISLELNFGDFCDGLRERGVRII